MTDFLIIFLTLLVLISICCFNLFALLEKIQFATIKFRENILIKQKHMEQQQNRRVKSIDLKIKKTVLEIQFQAEIYLIADLTLGMLSDKTKIPANQLSQVFAQVYHSNFNKIINRHRIDYAVKLLNNTEHKLSIDEISLMSGFNSRSSFYRAFRSVFKMTPSQYKRQQRDF